MGCQSTVGLRWMCSSPWQSFSPPSQIPSSAPNCMTSTWLYSVSYCYHFPNLALTANHLPPPPPPGLIQEQKPGATNALQLCSLLLPQTNRLRLHRVLRLISKAGANTQLQLSRTQSNREVVSTLVMYCKNCKSNGEVVSTLVRYCKNCSLWLHMLLLIVLYMWFIFSCLMYSQLLCSARLQGHDVQSRRGQTFRDWSLSLPFTTSMCSRYVMSHIVQCCYSRSCHVSSQNLAAA